MNNRPDLLTESSLTRILKIYLGLIDTPEMKLTKPTTSITVDPSVFKYFKLGQTYSSIRCRSYFEKYQIQ